MSYQQFIAHPFLQYFVLIYAPNYTWGGYWLTSYWSKMTREAGVNKLVTKEEIGPWQDLFKTPAGGVMYKDTEYGESKDGSCKVYSSPLQHWDTES